ncbi:hypothetical protein [Natronolimnobius baerhuensis]|uniref:Transporter n=1 Tax=Natronolimnobius baerhuensis TaxID=253108 RepID=A0A202E7D4_9EURY|nr:hypothetical protein [Natronolimnobius baerhuensis]OVE84155.1 hypothetical protein B2G88_06950 [Natronolimnobius baerhuensis]
MDRDSRTLEATIFASIAVILFLDVLFDISASLPDGWFHLLLGIVLFVSAIGLVFTTRSSNG